MRTAASAMTDEELKRIAAERGFTLVPTDRIKTVEADAYYTSYDADGDDAVRFDLVMNDLMFQIGGEISVKLREFKKLLVTRIPGRASEMVTVCRAKLDVIVPLSPPAPRQPKPVGGWVSREILARLDAAMERGEG